MALDTRNKRCSAVGVSLPWRGLLPAPDGSVDQPDRQQMTFLYSGITAAEPQLLQPSVITLTGLRTRSITLTGSRRRPVTLTGTL